MTLTDAEGLSYKIDLLARLSEVGTKSGSGRIEVTVRRCGGMSCTAGETYAAKFKPSEFRVAVDLSEAALQTRFFGFPLAVHLTALDAQQNLDGKAEVYQPALPTGQVRIWARQSRDTSARVTMVQRDCHAEASSVYREQILDGVVLELLAGLPTHLPAALAGVRTARCG